MISFQLTRAIRTKLGDLNFTYSDDTQANLTWSLRDRLMHGHADVQIASDHAFAFEIAADRHSDSLRYSWRHGLERVARHEVALSTLAASAKVPRAWTLVTCYYSAFFAASEVARANGIVVMHLNREQAAAVSAQSSTPGALDAGTYFGALRGNALGDAVEGQLVKSSRRGPHEIVWGELSTIVRRLSARSGEELRTQALLLSVLTGTERWRLPSAVRNYWNYIQPQLYQARGDQLAANFLGLAQQPGNAYAWSRARRVEPTEANQAASIAFVKSLLLDGMNAASHLLT